MVRFFTEFESNIVSVERINEYCYLPTEVSINLSINLRSDCASYIYRPNGRTKRLNQPKIGLVEDLFSLTIIQLNIEKT